MVAQFEGRASRSRFPMSALVRISAVIVAVTWGTVAAVILSRCLPSARARRRWEKILNCLPSDARVHFQDAVFRPHSVSLRSRVRSVRRLTFRYLKGFEAIRVPFLQWREVTWGASPTYDQVMSHVDDCTLVWTAPARFMYNHYKINHSCRCMTRQILFDLTGRILSSTTWLCCSPITSVSRLALQRIVRRFRFRCLVKKHTRPHLIPPLQDIVLAYLSGKKTSSQ